MSAPPTFADGLRALAAPEARILRRAYRIGVSGARITPPEAEVIYRQLDRDGQELLTKLRARTKRRWYQVKAEKAKKRAAADARRRERGR